MWCKNLVIEEWKLGSFHFFLDIFLKKKILSILSLGAARLVVLRVSRRPACESGPRRRTAEWSSCGAVVLRGVTVYSYMSYFFRNRQRLQNWDRCTAKSVSHKFSTGSVTSAWLIFTWILLLVQWLNRQAWLTIQLTREFIVRLKCKWKITSCGFDELKTIFNVS